MSKENIQIFENSETGVCFHNVGENGVLDSVGKNGARAVDRKYSLRGGHIPDARIIGLLADPSNKDVIDHVEYLSQIYGQKVNVFTLEDLVNRDALIVPYI